MRVVAAHPQPGITELVDEAFFARCLKAAPLYAPANLIVGEKLRLVGCNTRRHERQEQLSAFLTGRNEVLGGFRVVAVEAEQLEVVELVGVPGYVIDFDTWLAASLTDPVIALSNLHADLRSEPAPERAITADQEECVLGVDGELNVRVIEASVPKHPSHVTDVPRHFLAPSRTVESCDVEVELIEAIRAVVIYEVASVRDLDQEWWLHIVTIARRRGGGLADREPFRLLLIGLVRDRRLRRFSAPFLFGGAGCVVFVNDGHVERGDLHHDRVVVAEYRHWILRAGAGCSVWFTTAARAPSCTSATPTGSADG